MKLSKSSYRIFSATKFNSIIWNDDIRFHKIDFIWFYIIGFDGFDGFDVIYGCDVFFDSMVWFDWISRRRGR